ncbi:MAG: glycosyltransferase family protein [Flavobacteriales bacterium]|nr:glycosyltransferase family protein [Flavobacteriales bacterium]MCX7769006.1 glycosyltransferase family protein [Flavobacteriales bacterium]MDW8410205.1 glycosyltransferase family protein [Flavobacteriales bacterium]
MNQDARVALLVQARTGSTRLPGKVLKPVLGKPILQWMLERLKRTKSPDVLAVITTEEPADDAIVQLCESIDISCYRGSSHDLLDRHYKAGLHFSADAVVKVPSDCPLIDPLLVDKAIRIFRFNEFDYVSNLHPPTWPDGQDVEVVAMEALRQAWEEAEKPFQREHCTPFIWDQPERFALCNIYYPTGEDLSRSIRLTLDYPEDLEFLSEVMGRLQDPLSASVEEIVALVKQNPELAEINAIHRGKSWMDAHRHELKNL